MFGCKKVLKEIEESKRQLEAEKQELLFIKKQLEDSTPKVDISNIYVWKDNDLYSIVRLDIKKIHSKKLGGNGVKTDGYLFTLIDIFTDDIVYQKISTEKITRKQYILGKTLDEGHYGYFIPLYDVDRNLLAYVNKKVPLYVLQQLYYRLNNVDVNAYVLKKKKILEPIYYIKNL